MALAAVGWQRAPVSCPLSASRRPPYICRTAPPSRLRGRLVIRAEVLPSPQKEAKAAGQVRNSGLHAPNDSWMPGLEPPTPPAPAAKWRALL